MSTTDEQRASELRAHAAQCLHLSTTHTDKLPLSFIVRKLRPRWTPSTTRLAKCYRHDGFEGYSVAGFRCAPAVGWGENQGVDRVSHSNACLVFYRPSRCS